MKELKRSLILKPALEKAITSFTEIQAQVREQTTKNDREVKLVSVDLAGFDVRYAIEIGMFLGFHREPTTQSWIFAGRSYQMAEFCKKLFLDMTSADVAVIHPPSNDGSGYQNEPQEEEEDEEIISEFKPGGIVSTYLRMCFFKTWADRINAEIPYNSNAMTSTDTANEVAAFYSANSHKWDNCLTKSIPKQWIPKILVTAKNWETLIQSKKREASANRIQQPPEGDSAASWKIPSQRTLWENYYCTVLGEEKLRAPKTCRSKKITPPSDSNPKPSRKQRLNTFQSPHDVQLPDDSTRSSSSLPGVPSTGESAALPPVSEVARSSIPSITPNSRSLINDTINAGGSSLFNAELANARSEATRHGEQLALLVDIGRSSQQTGIATVNLLKD